METIGIKTDETTATNHQTNYVNLISYNAVDHKRFKRAIVLLNKSTTASHNDSNIDKEQNH